MSRELKEWMKTMSHRIENTDKEIQMIKNKKQANSGVEIYNWNANFTRGFNSRSELEEERISNLQDKPMETIESEEQKEKRMKKKNRASETWESTLNRLRSSTQSHISSLGCSLHRSSVFQVLANTPCTYPFEPRDSRSFAASNHELLNQPLWFSYVLSIPFTNRLFVNILPQTVLFE